MIWTNNHNLPTPVFEALTRSDYSKGGADFSVTELIRSPRQNHLLKRHDHEVVVDASEQVWRVIGTAVHEYMARHGSRQHFAEERLIVDIPGFGSISGQVDLFNDEYLLDYKVTSVYGLLLGEKPDWQAQLNCYAWLLRKHGITPKYAAIIAILRDWMQAKAQYESGYPLAAIEEVPVRLWTDDEVEVYIKRRIAYHKMAASLSDDNLPLCKPEERWERPTQYAVKKAGNKRATKVYDDMQEANHHAAVKGLIVEERPGESVRCNPRFCKARPWCNQAAQLVQITEEAVA